MYITLEEILQLGILICAIIQVIVRIVEYINGKRK